MSFASYAGCDFIALISDRQMFCVDIVLIVECTMRNFNHKIPEKFRLIVL